MPALKAQFNLGWAHLALSRHDFAALGRLQSAFADKAIDIALRRAWAETIGDTPLRGVFILGLGKLGGHDLNFSSDIDLIAYFDAERLPIPKAKGQAYLLGRVMKAMTRLLQPHHSPDFVYRVDWRLRPESSVTGLAMATGRAQDFYFYRALPWHRLALLKARVVAGDVECGEAFLSDLSPFIWRQNLDFRAIDELAALKTRINNEHPGLTRERAAPEPIGERPFGFNAKLGHGGIREIEFIANAQQMIWGGKHYGLRTTNTLQALDELGRLGVLDDPAPLSAAYRRHRQLENALQMMRNGHEHVLPENEERWTEIAALMNTELGPLLEQTTADRHRVSDRFEGMFAETDTGATAQSPKPPKPPKTLADDPVIKDWLAGFARYRTRPETRPQLAALGQALIQRIADLPDPPSAARTIDAFLTRLSRSEQYLVLLARNPALLDALIRPLLYSPHMAVLLEQSPHIIDTFLAPEPARADFVLAEADYETRLERLRRFVNEGLFQAYHGLLIGRDDWRQTTAKLTDLAEDAVATAVRIAEDDLGAKLPLAVIGLGKLGQRRMAPMSDLDLLFLFDDAVDRELAAKAVRRLRTIISARLSEGVAYELDMRLRPSGRSGPPAVMMGAFIRHHAEAARNWEHIALAQARVICGDASVMAEATKAMQTVLSRPRDLDQLAIDAHAMWARLKAERIKTVPVDNFDTKLRDGGLMMADFWGAVGQLTGGTTLDAARDGWTELLLWERLLGLTGQAIDAVPAPYSTLLPSDLRARQAALEAQVRPAPDAFPAPDGIDPMQAVRWTG